MNLVSKSFSMGQKLFPFLLTNSACFCAILICWTACNSPSEIKRSEDQILIKSGVAYTGENTKADTLNILIEGDKIIYVGKSIPETNDSVLVIDAMDLVVAPGFIDPHTHALEDLDDAERSHNLPFLSQGITTVVTGSDGRSPIPITASFDRWEKHGIGTNALMLVGHGQVRLNVLGDANRAPSNEELTEMKKLVEQAMEDGAYGISTGLYYAPGFFSKTEEIIELSKIVADYDGIYDTHQRDESSYSIGLLASVDEVITIGREANLPVHISHIKALGTDVWDKSNEVIKKIEMARAQGIDVTANQYPYIASGTGMIAATLPRWVQAGGEEEMLKRLNDPDQIEGIRAEMEENIRRRGGASSLLLIRPPNPDWKNKTLAQLAEQWRLSEVDAALKVIKEGDSGVASFNMKDSDLTNFMKQDWVVTGSDGSRNHPRKYGTFPRKIGKHALKDSVVTLGEAIFRSTARTAEIFKIKDRGVIKAGYFADIVIFDPQTIEDRAWFTNPEEFSTGIEYVIVNGEITIDRGNYQGNYPGRVLRKNAKD